jgi:dephospho-CoA kinase
VVVDADRLAHEVLEETGVRERVRERFGPGVFGASGRIDRAELARAVFRDAGGRAALEQWVHPRVRERIAAEIARAREQRAERIVLDVPLLLENEREHGLLELVDELVFVDAPADVRERRAREARGWPAGELARREAAQLPLAAKRARARHLIDNAGDLAALEAAVSDLLERLRRPARAASGAPPPFPSLDR